MKIFYALSFLLFSATMANAQSYRSFDNTSPTGLASIQTMNKPTAPINKSPIPLPSSQPTNNVDKSPPPTKSPEQTSNNGYGSSGNTESASRRGPSFLNGDATRK